MAARVGDYELLERIAVGGMAEVFLARKPGPEGFEKRVALKRILPHLGRDPEFVAMFLDEARLAARLQHPHLVHVYDFGLDGDSYFLAMEYVAGADVQALIRRSVDRRAPIPPATAALLLDQACEALHHAHELGVVHRDVTPANLLVSYGGVVKLADFGIAHAEERAARTQVGALKGKIPYMSPEQASGRAVDRRTDVYSLGVCGWELLTGQRLWSGGGDELALLERVQTGRPRKLRSARRDVPPELAAIVERALARDPADRWPTALAFGEALGAWAAATESARAPSGGRLRAYMGALFADEAADRAAPRPPVEPTAPITPPREIFPKRQPALAEPANFAASQHLSANSKPANFAASHNFWTRPPAFAALVVKNFPAHLSAVARRWVVPPLSWLWPPQRLPLRLLPARLELRARLAPLRQPRLGVSLLMLVLLAAAGLLFALRPRDSRPAAAPPPPPRSTTPAARGSMIEPRSDRGGRP